MDIFDYVRKITEMTGIKLDKNHLSVTILGENLADISFHAFKSAADAEFVLSKISDQVPTHVEGETSNWCFIDVEKFHITAFYKGGNSDVTQPA
jgi:hypothetical protein